MKYPLKYQFVGWIGLLIFIPLLFIPWTENRLMVIAIVATFVLLGILVMIEGKTTVEMNSEMIVKQKLFSRYGLRWDEIKAIQYAVSGDWITFETIVFEGDSKRLSIAGPRDWSGSKEAEARHWFYSKVGGMGLEIKENPAAAFRLSKNVRLS